MHNNGKCTVIYAGHQGKIVVGDNDQDLQLRALRPPSNTFTRKACLVDSDSSGPTPAPQVPRFFDQINEDLIQSVLGAWRRLWAMAAWADGGNTKPPGIVFIRSIPAPFLFHPCNSFSLHPRRALRYPYHPRFVPLPLCLSFDFRSFSNQLSSVLLNPSMPPSQRPSRGIGFFGMVAGVMAALKLKEKWDECALGFAAHPPLLRN